MISINKSTSVLFHFSWGRLLLNCHPESIQLMNKTAVKLVSLERVNCKGLSNERGIQGSHFLA